MKKDSQGRPLPPNLTHYKERDRYMYRSPSGKRTLVRNIRGEKASYEEAVAIATKANARRKVVQSKALTKLCQDYIIWAESRDPSLVTKRAWSDRRSELEKFAKEFADWPVDQLVVSALRPWWDALTYHGQHQRRAAFSRFFQWLIAEGVATQNPFTTSDEKARLFEKAKPATARMPLPMAQFVAIKDHPECPAYLRHAMMVSLVTMWRISDIVDLRLDTHVVDGTLRRANTKSVNQRTVTSGDSFSFPLDQYPELAHVIKEAQSRSFVCPYIIANQPKRLQKSKTKGHPFAVTRYRLSEEFARIRDLPEIANKFPVEPGRDPATFHCIKGLSIHEYLKTNELAKVSKFAGHTDKKITEKYAEELGPRFTTVDLKKD